MTTRYRQSWHLNESTIAYIVRYRDPLNKKRFAIPYKDKKSADDKMAQLKRNGVKEIEVTQDTLKPNVKFKEDLDNQDLSVVKKVISKLDKASDAHASQRDMLKKAVKEADLTKGQIKKVHKMADELPKKDFKDRYGNKEGDAVRYATATNIVKKKEGIKEAISPDQIKRLKDSWSDLKTIPPEKVKTLRNFLDRHSTDTLMQLAQANINFVSNMARSVIQRRKAADPKHAGSHKTHSMKETVTSDDDYRAKKKALLDIQSDPVKSSIVGRDKLQMRKDKLEKEYQAFKSGGGNKIAAQKEPEKGKKEIRENVHPAKALYEAIAAVKNKAKKTGMPYSILKQVYNRGMAAWKGGHRPGTTPQQWAMARVNSFVTKSSGTWGGADKDLAKKVRGSKD